jgi:DNA-binding transcriptional MocR family regulator
LFAEERVRRAVSRAAQRHRATLCQYTTGYGDESLRRAIARHALRMGCQIDPRDIVITNSCLESITLCLRAVTRPGDIVALESPTLFAFLEILENLHLRALEIPTHPRTGFSLEALQFALDTQPIKAVLAVPTLSNPIGSSIPLADRQRLAGMVADRGIPLIEDVLYNDLAEQDEQRRAVRSFDAVRLLLQDDRTGPSARLGRRRALGPEAGAHEGVDQRQPDDNARACLGRPADAARYRGRVPSATRNDRGTR